MNKTVIRAEVVAHSLNPQGDELVSLSITFPRIILAEINTHRMLSKNTSSSRAIPFKKMVEVVQNDPFIPIAWQKPHSGMQGNEYITDQRIINFKKGVWINNMHKAVKGAEELYYPVSRATSINDIEEIPDTGVTKQLCNRLLEPFMWTTMLITGSKEGWDNFFRLRCPQYYYDLEDKYFKSKKEWLTYYKANCIGDPNSNFELDEMDWFSINKGQSEIHMMDLSEKIYDAMNESTPKQLKAGEWHIPYEEIIDFVKLGEATSEYYRNNPNEVVNIDKWLVKVSTAMAARESYTVVGNEKDIDYQKQIDLHDRLISQDPPHSSPLEHCAMAMSEQQYNDFTKTYENNDYEDIYYRGKIIDKGWCRNFKGFIPYRYMIDNNLKM